MNFIINNWFILVATICCVVATIVVLWDFFRRPTKEQIAKVKEWLLYAVLAAEKELGSGTGTLKLRKVYDMFVARWGWIAQVVPFEVFSGWVDEALDGMKDILRNDEAVANYILEPVEE